MYRLDVGVLSGVLKGLREAVRNIIRCLGWNLHWKICVPDSVKELKPLKGYR
jgi:hypothetical protein